jgi:hypothetical protein
MLVNNIKIVKHLQEFYFLFGCSWEMLPELSKNCNDLKRLSMLSPKGEDDDSLTHLGKYSNLIFLDIDNPAVTVKGYSTILSHLNIAETSRGHIMLTKFSRAPPKSVFCQ